APAPRRGSPPGRRARIGASTPGSAGRTHSAAHRPAGTTRTVSARRDRRTKSDQPTTTPAPVVPGKITVVHPGGVVRVSWTRRSCVVGFVRHDEAGVGGAH